MFELRKLGACAGASTIFKLALFPEKLDLGVVFSIHVESSCSSSLRKQDFQESLTIDQFGGTISGSTLVPKMKGPRRSDELH